MPVYIIEHLEKKLWKWCLIEYENISKIAGKKNLWLANIKNPGERKILSKFGKVFQESIRELSISKKKICVLDPQAKKTLCPKDSKKFRYFVFGGILGDYPPRKRTKKELTTFFQNTNTRNLGKKQMSTDNAVCTAKEILKGKKISELDFLDRLEIKINQTETIELPYRYLIVGGKPMISGKLLEFMKRKRGF